MAYNSYNVACTEVEVDVLTGCTEILRVDMLCDCGERYNNTILHYNYNYDTKIWLYICMLYICVDNLTCHSKDS